MIRARSSLFLATLSCTWGFLFSLMLWNFVGHPNPYASDSWRDNEILVNRLELALIILTTLCFVASVILLRIDWRIRQGWEPSFLEIYKPGSTIIGSERLPEDKLRVIVRHADGQVQDYEADPDEAKEIQIGSLNHLWVIGQYISRIQLLKADAESAISTNLENYGLERAKRPFRAIVCLVIGVMTSAYLSAYGAVLCFGGSMLIPDWNDAEHHTYPDLYQDTWVHLLGLGVLVFGLLGLVTIMILWRRGWSEEALDRLAEMNVD